MITESIHLEFGFHHGIRDLVNIGLKYFFLFLVFIKTEFVPPLKIFKSQIFIEKCYRIF